MRVWVLNPPFLPKFSRPQRSPAVTKSGTIYYPIWLAFCTGVLEQAGHEVVLTDAPARGISLDATLEQGRRFQPQLLVLDTSTPSIENDMSVAARLKELVPGLFVVAVGTHVSALPEETLRNAAAFDAIALHEYDYTVRDLAAALSGVARPLKNTAVLQAIPGLCYRQGDALVRTPDRPFIENLDDLPWVSKVYKKHLRIGDYFNQNSLYPMITLITSRGCPFRCSFCVYPQTMMGRHYRFRSIGDVVKEMEYVAREFPEARSIFFEDDTLTANRKRCLELSDAILERGLKTSWTANSRVEVDAEAMRRLKAAGCRELCVGFESGDQAILDGMRKGTRLERMRQFMADARQAGMLIHGCFMVGFPGETEESVQRTIDLSLELSPDTAQFYPVMVYPGTEAYDEYRERGWITAKHYADWITADGLHNCVVRNERFTSAELVRWCDTARRQFYLRPRYLAYKVGQLVRRPSEIVRTLRAGRVFFRHLMRGSGV